MTKKAPFSQQHVLSALVLEGLNGLGQYYPIKTLGGSVYIDNTRSASAKHTLIQLSLLINKGQFTAVRCTVIHEQRGTIAEEHFSFADYFAHPDCHELELQSHEEQMVHKAQQTSRVTLEERTTLAGDLKSYIDLFNG
jgi:hypothetical protein